MISYLLRRLALLITCLASLSSCSTTTNNATSNHSTSIPTLSDHIKDFHTLSFDGSNAEDGATLWQDGESIYSLSYKGLQKRPVLKDLIDNTVYRGIDADQKLEGASPVKSTERSDFVKFSKGLCNTSVYQCFYSWKAGQLFTYKGSNLSEVIIFSENTKTSHDEIEQIIGNEKYQAIANKALYDAADIDNIEKEQTLFDYLGSNADVYGLYKKYRKERHKPNLLSYLDGIRNDSSSNPRYVAEANELLSYSISKGDDKTTREFLDFMGNDVDYRSIYSSKKNQEYRDGYIAQLKREGQSAYKIHMQLFSVEKNNSDLLKAKDLCSGDECIDYEKSFLDEVIKKKAKMAEVVVGEASYKTLKSQSIGNVLSSVAGTGARGTSLVTVKLNDNYQKIGLVRREAEIELEVEITSKYEVHFPRSGGLLLGNKARTKKINDKYYLKFILNQGNNYTATEKLIFDIILSAESTTLARGSQKGKIRGEVSLSENIIGGSVH